MKKHFLEKYPMANKAKDTFNLIAVFNREELQHSLMTGLAAELIDKHCKNSKLEQEALVTAAIMGYGSPSKKTQTLSNSDLDALAVDYSPQLKKIVQAFERPTGKSDSNVSQLKTVFLIAKSYVDEAAINTGLQDKALDQKLEEVKTVARQTRVALFPGMNQPKLEKAFDDSTAHMEQILKYRKTAASKTNKPNV